MSLDTLHNSVPNHELSEDEQIYRENVIDHYRNPRNVGDIPGADFYAEERNASCGDVLALALCVGDDGKVVEVKMRGTGCAISQAAASMLTEHIQGWTVEEMQALSEEHIHGLLGIPISPNRRRCALLSLRTLQTAITNSSQQS